MESGSITLPVYQCVHQLGKLGEQFLSGFHQAGMGIESSIKLLNSISSPHFLPRWQITESLNPLIILLVFLVTSPHPDNIQEPTISGLIRITEKLLSEIPKGFNALCQKHVNENSNNWNSLDRLNSGIHSVKERLCTLEEKCEEMTQNER